MEEDTNEVKIYIFAGQSNMYGKQVAETYSDIADLKEHIYYSFLRPSTRAENGEDPENIANVGPEYAFVKTMLANGVDNFVVLKSAFSGSSITQDRPFDLPDWHPDSVGELYDVMVEDYWALAQSIIDDGGVPVLEAIMWSQGGGDRMYLDTYEDNLNYFYDQLQEDLQQRIDMYLLDETHALEDHLIEDLNGVREIQHKFAAERDSVTLFRTEPYTFVDGLHFDASSQWDMGNLLAQDVLSRLHGDDGSLMLDAPENVFFDGDGLNAFVGTDADDLALGFKGDDFLDGMGGNDNLIGDGGDDTLYGRNGSDYLDGGQGQNIAYGGFGNDTLVGRFGALEGYGGAGDDILAGWNLDDVLNGGIGNDDIDGGDGNDILRGGRGDDDINAGAGDDQIFGAAGDDILRTGSGNDFVRGGAGNDTIILGDGADRVGISFGEIGDGVDRVSGFDPDEDSIVFIQNPTDRVADEDLLAQISTMADGDDLAFYYQTDAGDVHFLTIANAANSSIEAMYDDGTFVFV